MIALASPHVPLPVLLNYLAEHWLFALGLAASLMLLALAVYANQLSWRATYSVAAVFAMTVTLLNPATVLG